MKQYKGYKLCSKCKCILPICCFFNNRSTVDGLAQCCRECRVGIRRTWYVAHAEQQKAHSRAWYEAHKKHCNDNNKIWRTAHREQYKATNRKHRQTNQFLLDKIKSSGCVLCGYSKCRSALSFHHIISEDKKFQIVANHITRPDFIDELNKCMLLCCRCHFEIHEKTKRKGDKEC